MAEKPRRQGPPAFSLVSKLTEHLSSFRLMPREGAGDQIQDGFALASDDDFPVAAVLESELQKLTYRADNARMIPIIETERLELRGPTAEDFPAYRDFFADAEASAFYGGPLEAERAWRVLAADLGHWQLRGYGRWSVIEKVTGKMVGGCGLWWPEGWPRSELTWWIVPTARRFGYALEASRAAIAFGYDYLGWPLVETHMNDTNLAARKLVEKLGGIKLVRHRFPDGLERDVFRLPRPLLP